MGLEGSPSPEAEEAQRLTLPVCSAQFRPEPDFAAVKEARKGERFLREQSGAGKQEQNARPRCNDEEKSYRHQYDTSEEPAQALGAAALPLSAVPVALLEAPPWLAGDERAPILAKAVEHAYAKAPLAVIGHRSSTTFRRTQTYQS